MSSNCCSSSSHVELDETWSSKGSLQKTSWMPFGQEYAVKESYCSSCSMGQNYNKNPTQWTTNGNVTPRDSLEHRVITKNSSPAFSLKIKENFPKDGSYVDNGDYVTLAQTWANQKRYSS